MALVGRRGDHQMRPPNKEPEWSSICNNVFEQYTDFDDPFGLGPEQRQRSSSDDSGLLFDFSGSSGQSNHTSDTSPMPSTYDPSLDRSLLEAKQPRPQEPGDFWAKKLQALEQNAAASEIRQQKLRTTKSHPDFLSLGGFPSPPVCPPSPIDQSFSAQRRKSRSAANGRKTPTQRCVTTSRSVSRGRPVGVTKAAPPAAVNPYATVRRCSASPSKMMNPSRYRAGFKDVWAERIEASPKKYQLRVPSNSFPASPPPSARDFEDEFAAFGSPAIYPSLSGHDEQVSPLTTTFQQARIHTPIASPLLSPVYHSDSSYFEQPLLPSHPYHSSAAQTILLNDTAPLFPERTSSLAPNRIQHFDFGFSTSPDIDQWSGASFSEPTQMPYSSASLQNLDPFAINQAVSQRAAYPDIGLGISCDPSLNSNYATVPGSALLPTTPHAPQPHGPYYAPMQPHGHPYAPYQHHGHAQPPHGLPQTPQRASRSRFRSESPTSPPLTEARNARSKSRRPSSRHRRTKSTNATPRAAAPPAEKGGFVNYTPHDHGKILNGVAPSGSSKTKARREKEAADKRRRLSQAAVRAIVEAGGDPDTLTKAGLVL